MKEQMYDELKELTKYIREKDYEVDVLRERLLALSFNTLNNYKQLMQYKNDVLEVFLPILKESDHFAEVIVIDGEKLDYPSLHDFFDKCREAGLTFQKTNVEISQIMELKVLVAFRVKYREVLGEVTPVFLKDLEVELSDNLEGIIPVYADQLAGTSFYIHIEGDVISNSSEYGILIQNIRLIKDMGLQVKVMCPHPLVPTEDYLRQIGYGEEDTDNELEGTCYIRPVKHSNLLNLSDEDFKEVMNSIKHNPSDKYNDDDEEERYDSDDEVIFSVSRRKAEFLLEHYIRNDNANRVLIMMDSLLYWSNKLPIRSILMECATPCPLVIEAIALKLPKQNSKYTNWACPDNAEHFIRLTHPKEIRYEIDGCKTKNALERFNRFVEFTESMDVKVVFTDIHHIRYIVNENGYHVYMMTVLGYFVEKGIDCKTIKVDVIYSSTVKSIPLGEMIKNLTELHVFGEEYGVVFYSRVALDSQKAPVDEILESGDYKEFLRAFYST